MLAKAPTLGADEAIVDLEDAVAPAVWRVSGRLQHAAPVRGARALRRMPSFSSAA